MVHSMSTGSRRVGVVAPVKAVISPWWAHSLQLWGLSLLPEAVSVYFLNWQHQEGTTNLGGWKETKESVLPNTWVKQIETVFH